MHAVLLASAGSRQPPPQPCIPWLLVNLLCMCMAGQSQCSCTWSPPHEVWLQAGHRWHRQPSGALGPAQRGAPLLRYLDLQTKPKAFHFTSICVNRPDCLVACRMYTAGYPAAVLVVSSQHAQALSCRASGFLCHNHKERFRSSEGQHETLRILQALLL